MKQSLRQQRFVINAFLIGLLIWLFVISSIQPDASTNWREIMKTPDSLNGYYYATPYAYSNQHYGIMRVWNQGYAKRIEMVNHGTGETMIILTRQQDGAYYHIDPQRNEAIGYRYREEVIPDGVLDEDRYAVSGDRYDPVFLSRISEVEYIEYNGQETIYFEYFSSHRHEEEIYRAWISVEYGLPLKEEMVMADERVHQRIYTDHKEGPFPQELFTLPEDLDIIGWTWYN